jgi:hypothetical protein
MKADPLPEFPRARGDLFYQDVSDGGVLFDPARERMVVLNASAAFVWSCCDGAHSIPQIARELGDSLGDRSPDEARLVEDVESSLRNFSRQGLLDEA